MPLHHGPSRRIPEQWISADSFNLFHRSIFCNRDVHLHNTPDVLSLGFSGIRGLNFLHNLTALTEFLYQVQ